MSCGLNRHSRIMSHSVRTEGRETERQLGFTMTAKKRTGLNAASVRHGCFMEAGVTQSAGSDRLIT